MIFYFLNQLKSIRLFKVNLGPLFDFSLPFHFYTLSILKNEWVESLYKGQVIGLSFDNNS